MLLAQRTNSMCDASNKWLTNALVGWTLKIQERQAHMADLLNLDDWDWADEEPSGETDKQWLREPASGSRWLFKPNKPDRSQDEASSEYAAGQIARLFNVPAATVSLGLRNGILGCISLNVVSAETHGLVDAATFLSAMEEDFDPRDRQSRGHNQENIVRLLRELDPPAASFPGVTATEIFADYLLFDAFIGNTDRHSKNWAIETRLDGPELLAPTFDHATSLGITSRGRARERLLGNLTAKTVEAFAERAHAGRFEDGRDQSLVTYAMLFLRRYAPDRASLWQQRLETLDMCEVHDAIRSSAMSPPGVTLALAVTTTNRERMLRCLR
ncbi:HipA domain-containing protein [Arthrobacter sp. Z1-15]